MAIAPQYQDAAAPQRYAGQLSAFQTPSFQPYQQQGALSRFFLGTPEHTQQYPKFTPQGYDILSQLLSGGINQLQNPYQGYEPLQQETMNQFYQDILPGIAERFASQRGGRLSSPDFQSQLASGASGLASVLNAQKTHYGMAQQQNALQQLGLGLQQPFDYAIRPSTPGFFENTFNNLTQAIPTAAKALPFFL